MSEEKYCNNIVKLGIVVISAFVIFFFLYKFIPTDKGDMLEILYYIGGIISGIFAFGAFFVASITYLNQKETGDLQRFENTLFNMLSLQQQITNELKYYGSEPVKFPIDREEPIMHNITKRGREIFEFMWKEKCFTEFDKDNTGRILLDNKIWYEGMSEVLMRKENGYDSFREVAIFDHYFRHLYRIIKFIDDAKWLGEVEQYKYTSIVRATLSSYELVWLYYNCLYGAGQPKFKSLIEKYAFLKNLRDEFLTISREVIDKDYFNKYSLVSYDYEAHLTDKKGVPDKYYLGAFYNERNPQEFSQGLADYKKM